MAKRARSPKYPSISLGVAIDRTKDLYEAEKRTLVPREVAVKAWGYTSLNGRSLTLLAAILQYGLLRNEKGHVGISDDAFTILNAPPKSSEKASAIERCAKAPSVFNQLLSQYPDGIPSDDTLNWFLVQNGFTAQAAETTLKCFRGTLSYVEEQKKDCNNGGNSQEIGNSSERMPPMNHAIALSPPATQDGVKSWSFPVGTGTAQLTLSGVKNLRKSIELVKKLLDLYVEGLDDEEPT